MVRFKNRWILAELLPAGSGKQQAFEAKHIWHALKQSALTNFGDTGWGAIAGSLTVKYYSPTTNICIIRVSRDQHKIAWGALTLLSSIEGCEIIPHVIHVSGTIKHAQLASIEHNRTVIARYRAKSKTPAAYHDSHSNYLEKSNAEIAALRD